MSISFKKIIILLLLILFVINSVIIFYQVKEIKQIKSEIKSENSMIIQYPKDKVCYMPKDCFETEEEYLDQFPGKEEPKLFAECLVYCYKGGEK